MTGAWYPAGGSVPNMRAMGVQPCVCVKGSAGLAGAAGWEAEKACRPRGVWPDRVWRGVGVAGGRRMKNGVGGVRSFVDLDNA